MKLKIVVIWYFVSVARILDYVVKYMYTRFIIPYSQ